MRGHVDPQASMFTYFSPETRVPAQHPLRSIKAKADAVLGSMSAEFDRLYADSGRPSIAPERLLKANLLCDEHFTVDGTLIEAWASLKSFKSKDGPPSAGDGSGGMVDFRGERRTNDTHESTTDDEAKLMRKGKGKEAKPSYGARCAHDASCRIRDQSEKEKARRGNLRLDEGLWRLASHVRSRSRTGATARLHRGRGLQPAADESVAAHHRIGASADRENGCFASCIRLLAGLAQYEPGVGVSYEFAGEHLWVWRFDRRWLVKTMAARRFRLRRRLMGSLTETHTRLRGFSRNALVHLNNVALKLGGPKSLSATSLFVFEKKAVERHRRSSQGSDLPAVASRQRGARK